jgi:hypothetical protein
MPPNMKPPLNSYACLSALMVAVVLPMLTPGTTLAQTGGLTLERWQSIPGPHIGDLINVLSSKAPVSTAFKAGSATLLPAVPYRPNSGARLRGSLTIPEDGYYTFYISGDDQVDLWISLNGQRTGLQRLAWSRGGTLLHDFSSTVAQHSRPIRLGAGQVCQLEALQKNASGQDHLSIGWTRSLVPVCEAAAVGTVDSQTWTAGPDAVVQASVDAGALADGVDHTGFYGTSWTGDVEVITRVRELAAPNAHARVGLMLRTSAQADAAAVSLVRNPSGGLNLLRRMSTGGQLYEVVCEGAFEWLKLQRSGAVVTAWASREGIRWHRIGKVSFSSLPATLQAGVCATDGSAASSIPVTATVSDFQILPSAQAPAVIAGEHLTAAVADPLDGSDDGLPDSWQTSHGLSAGVLAAGAGAFDDPDGDGRNNLQEYQEATEPLVAEPVQGGLAVQRWLDVACLNVTELVRHPRFLAGPQVSETCRSSELRDIRAGTGVRLRGYVTAPASGTYRFWVAGCDGVELWLSTDNTKYRKQKLCGIGADTGAGYGIEDEANPFGAWDSFSSQLSAPVELVAGQRYFIEMLETSVHNGAGWVAVAWARNGGVREPIPVQHLEGYLPDSGDADDDYLPDAWETSYGLNPADNGQHDLAREGEWGDYDGDQLTNREEYLLGTNPASVDTDGDGASDLDEVRFYKTSPTTSNAIVHEAADPVDLTAYNALNTSGSWQMFDGGLLGNVFRGNIEWTITVPEDGWWMLEVKGRLRGKLRPHEELPVSVRVDDQGLAPQGMTFTNGNPSSMKMVMPYLTAGSHRVRLDIDNNMGRRTFQIQSVQVLSTGGFDGDGNGRSDWLDAILENGNNLAPGSGESVVSPAFTEGAVRHPGGVLVGVGGGGSFIAPRGLGDHHWYANVPLAQSGPTQINVGFESGGITRERSITWTRWNALGGANLVVRVGDSVKIGAWTSETDAGTSSIVLAGTTHAGIAAANGSLVHTFTSPGNFTVGVTHSSGATANRVITVVGADFGQPQAFYADWATWRTFGSVPTSLWVDAEPSLVIASRKASGTGQQLQLLAGRHGQHAVAARLTPSGPIVSLGVVSTVGIADALQNDAEEFVGSTGTGQRIMRAPIVVADLPPGGKVVITIFRSGFTFLDGTTVKTLTAADFTAGVAYLDFLYPGGMEGGYCHYIDVYDAQNRHLGRH